MILRILPSAVADLASGRNFYEQQGEGLGSYFLNTLFADIDYHRLLSKRFPYAIYYRLHDNTVEVWRVLDLRQEPEQIKKALG